MFLSTTNDGKVKQLERETYELNEKFNGFQLIKKILIILS